MTGDCLHPCLILLLGGIFIPFLKERYKQLFILLVPIFGLANLWGLNVGDTFTFNIMGFELVHCRVDKMALLFAYIFHIAAFLCMLYSLHLKDDVQLATGMMYAGSAVGAVFAGDFVTLFLFWELLAVTSVFQVWARKSKESFGAGQRYLTFHI